MKKAIFIISVLFLTSCRVGDFTMMSTKNVDSSKMSEYVLLKANVKGKSINLETAADRCVEKVEGGVFLQNVVISEGLVRYHVKGDVWGKKKAE